MVALVDPADVVCAADVDDCAPADDVPGEAGLEAAADRAADGAVADIVGEPGWRVPDGVEARAADCARPDELAAWAVALGVLAAEPAADELVLGLALAAEPVAIELMADGVLGLATVGARVEADWAAAAAEPVAGVAAAGEAPLAVVLAADLLVGAAPALVEARD
jgi:hypothetical protein